MLPQTFTPPPFRLPGKRNIIGEWSVEKAAKTSRFFTDSCKALDMKKLSRFLRI